MKQKPLVMGLLGAALIGAYFFLARRASAATVNGAGGAAAAGTSGALGSLPFSDIKFPGGGSSPLAFEGGAGGVPLPGRGSLTDIKSDAGGIRLRGPVPGGLGDPNRFAPPMTPKPPLPRPAPRPAIPRNPAPIRVGAVPRPTAIPKGGVRRFLN